MRGGLSEWREETHVKSKEIKTIGCGVFTGVTRKKKDGATFYDFFKT